jgi:murein L,D-transpeptidase YcbB/YkuD
MVTGLSGQEGLRLDLNIPAQRLVVIDGGRVVKSYPVSVGLPGHATPTGEFRVRRAEWNPWWHPPERAWARNKRVTPPGPNNPMGRVKLFFAPYYYLHGTPHVDDLGSPASHGCVRMRNSDAIELATMLHHRAEPTVPATAIRGILARPRQTRWVEFRSPVALTIRYDPVVVRNGELRIYRDFYKHGAVHSEAVYQALVDAGYDASSIDRSTVRSLVRRATASRETLIVPVHEAFAGISGGPSREEAGR